MKLLKLSTHYILLLIVLSLIFSLAGCGDQNSQQTPERQPEKRTLTIGLIPEHNLFRQKERYKPLAEYLTQETDLIIKLKIFPSYGNIIENFLESKLDGAFLGSFTFVLLREKIAIEPLAKPENLDGNATSYGMVFVRKDSGVNNGKAMRDKSFAFVDKVSTAGYLLPLSYFKQQDIGDFNSWFKEVYFTGTHEDAIYDVLNKKADVGAAKNSVYYRLAKEDKRVIDELKVLIKSPPVTENCLALSMDIDPIIKEQIKKTLLNMHKSQKGKKALEQFGANKFIEAQSGDYEPVYQLAKQIGINLTEYDYLNK